MSDLLGRLSGLTPEKLNSQNIDATQRRQELKVTLNQYEILCDFAF